MPEKPTLVIVDMQKAFDDPTDPEWHYFKRG